MTIASEIERLQEAKATARTSIINKGVNVPTSASVEDYHTYIDQIKTSSGIWTFTGSMALRYIAWWGENNAWSNWWCASIIYKDYMFIATLYNSSGSRSDVLYALFMAVSPWSQDWSYVYNSNITSGSNRYYFVDYWITTTDNSITIVLQHNGWYVQGVFSFTNNTWTVTQPSTAVINQWWQNLFTMSIEVDEDPLILKFTPNLSNN